MKIIKILCIALLVSSGNMFAQQEQQISGKTNTNKFRQLYDEFSTPNMFRTGSGAPGPAYYQQQADYVIDIELDEKNKRIHGFETITYTNNSPDALNYLWIQLDQNRRAKDSKSPLIETSTITEAQIVSDFTKSFLKEKFDGGFNIEDVKDINGNTLAFTINRTMMRVELPETIQAGSKFSFSIKWSFNINNHITVKGRSGYEDFPDGNSNFVIAQFYPRMAVYNDVEGWQNSQFWGRGEFALPFGNFEVNITVPSDHILDGTGRLLNREEVYSREMMKRYKLAKKSYEEPVVIVNTEEAEKASKQASKYNKTWKLYAENVRDFAFATSRFSVLIDSSP